MHFLETHLAASRKKTRKASLTPDNKLHSKKQRTLKAVAQSWVKANVGAYLSATQLKGIYPDLTEDLPASDVVTIWAIDWNAEKEELEFVNQGL